MFCKIGPSTSWPFRFSRSHERVSEGVNRAFASGSTSECEMSDEDWSRCGWHSESGLYSAETWLRIYADHAHNHAEQIVRLQGALNSAAAKR